MNQQKAMEDLNKEDEFQDRLGNINYQIRQTKQEIKSKSEKYKETEKVIQDEHVQIYDLEERHRKLCMIIKGRKKQQKQNTT